MRPKKNMPTNAVDLFRSRLDQIINLKHELAQLAGKIDWNWLDERDRAALQRQRPAGVETRFVIGPVAAQAHLRPVRRGGLRALGR